MKVVENLQQIPADYGRRYVKGQNIRVDVYHNLIVPKTRRGEHANFD